jgi:hypothetical protein
MWELNIFFSDLLREGEGVAARVSNPWMWMWTVAETKFYLNSTQILPPAKKKNLLWWVEMEMSRRKEQGCKNSSIESFWSGSY